MYNDNAWVMRVVEPFAVTLTYDYDDLGNQTRVVNSFGGTQVSVYDLEDRLTRRDYVGHGQQLRVDLTYDPLHRIDTISRYKDSGGLTLVAASDYDYDANGRITHILHTDSSYSTGLGNQILADSDWPTVTTTRQHHRQESDRVGIRVRDR